MIALLEILIAVGAVGFIFTLSYVISYWSVYKKEPHLLYLALLIIFMSTFFVSIAMRDDLKKQQKATTDTVETIDY